METNSEECARCHKKLVGPRRTREQDGNRVQIFYTDYLGCDPPRGVLGKATKVENVCNSCQYGELLSIEEEICREIVDPAIKELTEKEREAVRDLLMPHLVQYGRYITVGDTELTSPYNELRNIIGKERVETLMDDGEFMSRLHRRYFKKKSGLSV